MQVEHDVNCGEGVNKKIHKHGEICVKAIQKSARAPLPFFHSGGAAFRRCLHSPAKLALAAAAVETARPSAKRTRMQSDKTDWRAWTWTQVQIQTRAWQTLARTRGTWIGRAAIQKRWARRRRRRRRRMMPRTQRCGARGRARCVGPSARSRDEAVKARLRFEESRWRKATRVPTTRHRPWRTQQLASALTFGR